MTANTTAMSAFLPEVMNCFTPFSTYSPPLRSARVVIADASEPDLRLGEREGAQHAALRQRF